MPVKQVPNHYNHGERAHKHCLICEGKARAPLRGKDAPGMPQQQPSGNQQNSREVREERKKLKADLLKQDSNGPVHQSSQEAHSQAHQNAVSLDFSEPQPSAQPNLQKTQSTKKPERPISPARRGEQQETLRRGEQDFEEFQRRRISLNDFVEGQPPPKLTLSGQVRKFNRELLKATCQVIGCKPINANQIAEGVFDELNQLLNDLAEGIEFELFFGLASSGDEPGKARRQIASLTTSTPLFKFVLSRHLEKYKYSRPEYLKDFFIAADLVRKRHP